MPVKNKNVQFTQQFARALAMGQFPEDELIRAFGLPKEEAELIFNDAVFKETVMRYAKEFQDNGITAKSKAAIAVELLIPTMFQMANNEGVDDHVRKGCFDSLVSISGFKANAEAPVTPPGPAIPRGSVAIVFMSQPSPTEKEVVPVRGTVAIV